MSRSWDTTTLRGAHDVRTHLHFDCFSGVSGDMVLGALIDTGLPLKELVRALKAVPVEGYGIRTKRVTRGGLQATKLDVVIREGSRSPLAVSEIRQIIDSSTIPESVRALSHAVFDRLARAEAAAHGVSVDKVHFHEVGVVDSLVDVIGSLLGCDLLGVSRYTATPVNVGSGWMTFSHGRLPVPGPAASVLAKGLPIYSAGPQQELATPTGVALLSVLVKEFGPLPLIRPTAVGYGAGSADFEGWPNALRVFVGECASVAYGSDEVIVQIETNLDDLHPQAYETVMDRLFAGGALDVTLTQVIMKRGRPGVILGVLAPREKAEHVVGIVLRETSALGVRMQEVSRRVLPRRIETARTRWGEVRIKVAEVEPGMVKAAPEYLDCRRIAEQSGKPVREVMEAALRMFHAQGASKKAKGKKEKVRSRTRRGARG